MIDWGSNRSGLRIARRVGAGFLDPCAHYNE
jgi:hypothetical protein